MFENLVKDAALPVVLELMSGLHKGLDDVIQTEKSRMTGDQTFDNAIRQAKLDAFADIILIIEGMAKIMEVEHTEHHGKPPAVSAPHSNFNHAK